MRKINDQELIPMMDKIKSGEITQKALAERFGVSPSAVNQRIKRLMGFVPPESFARLTANQQAFALAKVEGKTNLEAVRGVYNVATNESAKSLASQLMHEPDVKLAIHDLMAQEGIPKRRRIRRLRDMIECGDLSVAGKGLDMSFKLTGDYSPERVEVIVDPRQIIASLEDIERRLQEAGVMITDDLTRETIDVTPKGED